jgi:Peroxisome biogenesis factor 1, N-terminal
MKDNNSETLIGVSSALDIPRGIIVSVKALTYVDDAIQCFIEPMTADDWELLEAHADWLEGGGLLQQVCVIYPDQILALTVGRNDLARVRVLRSTFSQKNDHCNKLWPDAYDSNSSTKSRLSVAPCLRLVADTNVIVSPKKRETTKLSKCNHQLRLNPSEHDYCNTLNWKALNTLTLPSHKLVSVLPFSVVVHPDIASRLIGTVHHSENKLCIVSNNLTKARGKHQELGSQIGNSSAVVCLSASVDVPVDCAGT